MKWHRHEGFIWFGSFLGWAIAAGATSGYVKWMAVFVATCDLLLMVASVYITTRGYRWFDEEEAE